MPKLISPVRNYLPGGYKYRFILIALGLLLSFGSSLRWIYPLYLESKPGSNLSFLPIYRTAITGRQDDVFYYSLIREIIDGRFPTSPGAYEQKVKISPHSSYALSLFMCSLGGLITGKTEYAYYFNHLVYPFLIFILTYLLFNQLTRARYLSLLLALLLFFFSGIHKLLILPTLLSNIFIFIKDAVWGRFFLVEFSPDYYFFRTILRTPNILFTSIPILCFAILLFLKTEKKESRIVDIALISTLTLSSLTSISNFIVSFSIYIVILAIYLVTDRRLGISLFKLLLLAILISIPGIYIIVAGIKALTSTDTLYYVAMDHFDIKINNKGTLKLNKEFLSGLMFTVPYLFILSLVKFNHKKYILGAMWGIMLAFVVTILTGGTLLANSRIINNVGGFLFSCLTLSGVVIFLSERSGKLTGVGHKEKQESSPLKTFGPGFLGRVPWPKVGKTLVLTLAFVLAFCHVIGQYQMMRAGGYTLEQYNDPRFKELYLWSLKETGRDDVVVTLDFNILANFPIYSPVNVYIPVGMLNALPLEEIHRRFFETLSQYGISPEELREILDKMPRYATEGELNLSKNQMGLMNYVLFFSRHCFRPEEFRSDKEKLIAGYKEAIKKGEVALTFKADYLILSNVDQKWVKEGSFIERLISRKSPLFDNGFYQVYPIK